MLEPDAFESIPLFEVLNDYLEDQASGILSNLDAGGSYSERELAWRFSLKNPNLLICEHSLKHQDDIS